MNRVNITILERGTSIPSKLLEDATDPSPFRVAFQTERFPVYPITICIYLQNPPFNKFSVCFKEHFAPSRGTLYGSQDGHTYTKFHELTELEERGEYIKIFKEKLFFCYVRLILEEPTGSQSNLCRQIYLGGIEFSMVNYFNTRFACSLSAKISHHPTLFRLLEILQYKGLLLREKKNKLYQKYESRLFELMKVISEKGFNKVYPDESMLEKWQKQIGYIESEPIYKQGVVQYPDPVKVKRDIYRLQKELRNSEFNNFGQIKPDVLHYFQKYHNFTVKDRYLRYLSSSLPEDHKTALVEFWNDVKQLTQITPAVEEAVVMYFNFYLEFIDSTLITSAIKTLILFSKRLTNPDQSLSKVYERILENILRYLHQTEDQELRQLSLKCSFILYDKIDNQVFLQVLLGQYKRYPLEQQTQKLEILQKLTFRRVFIEDRSLIIDFLVQLLLNNQLNLTDKNRAYNVAAYLASRFGKANIMKDFEKLNSMILMTMEKNIDNKIGKIGNNMDQTQQTAACQYCGLQNKNFKDQNLLDLHLAKQCKFITTCDYCHQNVEIPELFKHYIEQCRQKHNFKHCDNCFEVIHLKQEQKHKDKCAHKLQTRCPLCYQKIDNKLKLKEHILTEGCPNNPR